jgi:nucleoside-diphosphate-sugar epimerase
MIVTITGGAGFIGSHLCQRFLSKKTKVICIDNFSTGSKDNITKMLKNPDFSLIKYDITIPFTRKLSAMIMASQIIIHLASPASPKDYYRLPLETALVNSVGSKYLLDLARSGKKRFVLASTSEIYGNPEQNPQKEEYRGHVNPVGPRSCYDESKRFSEMLTMIYYQQFGVDTRICRIFNTYGPGMRRNDGRVVANFISHALQGEDLIIYGDGTQTRSFCYIDDTVEGIYLLAVKPGLSGKIVNIGNPEEIRIKDLANLIIKLTDSFSRYHYIKKVEDDPEKRCPDITRIKTLLAWEPQVNLVDGLKKTINFLRNNS